MTTIIRAKRFLRILPITSNLQTPIIIVDTQHLSITLAVLITTLGSNKKILA